MKITIISPSDDNVILVANNKETADKIRSTLNSIIESETNTHDSWCKMPTDPTELTPETDEIEKSILDSGYIDNSQLWRRWIMAQMLRHCDSHDTSDDNRSKSGYGPGFDKYFISGKPYRYVFDTTINELKALKHLTGTELTFRERFFNKDVVFEILERYEISITKYIKHRKQYLDEFKTPIKYLNSIDPNTVKEDIYVKMPHTKAPYNKIYIYSEKRRNSLENFLNHLHKYIKNIENNSIRFDGSTNYQMLYNTLLRFTKVFPINIDLPKPDAWKNAFKGAGAFYTMDNMIKFHECRFEDEKTHEPASLESSLLKLNDLTNMYHDCYYKLYAVLRNFMEYNNFNYETLCKRIHDSQVSE